MRTTLPIPRIRVKLKQKIQKSATKMVDLIPLEELGSCQQRLAKLFDFFKIDV